MKKVTRIQPTAAPSLPRRKRVAAYARVSMETERLHHSLSAQVSYYSQLIQSNPEWVYAGVYADEGISGTSATRRPEFQRLLDDCENGLIDIVLTKSISRFARNTVDLLNTVRRLKELGVSVRFEKEGIDSLSGDGEVMLTLLASFAQSESESISANVKWGKRKRMQAGLPDAAGHQQVYGYRWEGDRLVIVPEEAEVVRRIYRNFLDGKSRLETERELEAEGIRTRAGNRWMDSNIKVVLTNVTYTGNMLFQKEYVADPITGRKRKNRGELPQYFVEGTHEAIIPMDVFQHVQEEMARRRELGCFANKSLTLSCLSTRVKCGVCGRSFIRCTRRNRAQETRLGDRYTYWTCTSHKSGGKACPSGLIRETVLKEECAKALGLAEFDEAVFAERIDHIVIPGKGTLEFHYTDGTTETRRWERHARKDCWTPEYRRKTSEYRKRHAMNRPGATCFTCRLRCAGCGGNLNRSNRHLADGAAYGYWHCHGASCPARHLREDRLKQLTAQVLGLPEFDEATFTEQVEYIEVTDGTRLTYHLTSGGTVEVDWPYEGRSRHIDGPARVRKHKKNDGAGMGNSTDTGSEE